MQRLLLNQDKSNWDEIIARAITVLKSGGMVIAPSDTVYGLLVDAKNKQAVHELTRFKERPPGRPISIFVSNFEDIKEYAEMTTKNEEILKQILPGSYTVILKSKHRVVKNLESEDQTIGIRLPNYEFILKLVGKYGSPLTATSANLSGQSPIYSVTGFLQNLSQVKLEFLDLVIDAGRLPLNKPSTVIDLTEDKLKIKRMGDVLPRAVEFISKNTEQTKQMAQKIIKENQGVLKTKPLVIILEGDLGAGKTVFVKGIGEYLGIKNIISPTFVIYYEYYKEKSKFQNLNAKLIHVDLYNVKEEKEFEHLGLEKYLKPGNILCFEWGEKSGAIMNLLKEKGKVIYVKMEYMAESKRKITINF